MKLGRKHGRSVEILNSWMHTIIIWKKNSYVHLENLWIKSTANYYKKTNWKSKSKDIESFLILGNGDYSENILRKKKSISNGTPPYKPFAVSLHVFVQTQIKGSHKNSK